MTKAGRWLGVALLALASGACSSGPPPKCDQILDVYLNGGGDLNPGPDGQPLPVVVRIYQLKERAKFDAADFHTIWQDDAATLGADVLDKSELTLFPSTSETRRFWRKAEAAYLALVAIFRNPSGNDWRQVLSLPDAEKVKKTCKDNPGQPVRIAHHFSAKASILKTEPETAVAR